MNKQKFNLELKHCSDNGIFSGYASVFNIIDENNDVILNGAFKNSIESKSIKLLWQHCPDNPIGKIEMIKEDNYGLHITCRLCLSIQKGYEAHCLLKSGIINGLSFGYNVIEEYSDYKEGIRYIELVDLWEVSLVTFPCNTHAFVNNVNSKEYEGTNNVSHEMENFDKSLKFAIETLNKITY